MSAAFYIKQHACIFLSFYHPAVFKDLRLREPAAPRGTQTESVAKHTHTHVIGSGLFW